MKAQTFNPFGDMDIKEWEANRKNYIPPRPPRDGPLFYGLGIASMVLTLWYSAWFTFAMYYFLSRIVEDRAHRIGWDDGYSAGFEAAFDRNADAMIAQKRRAV